MSRILADLPDDDIEWLDRIAAESGRSRAAVLREAVTAYRSAHVDWLERGDEFEETVRPRWSTIESDE